MTWTLGIDSSSFELGLGLYKDQSPVCGYSRYVSNSHAEHIVQSVDLLLKSNNVRPEDINQIGIAAGPGSFTGLRIGIAFVKGFCFDRPVRLLPISSLESVAHAWPAVAENLIVAFDARRSEVFWARFERGPEGIRRLTDDTLATASEFINAIKPGDTIITDSLGYANSVVLDEAKLPSHPFRIENNPVQRGLACAGIAARSPDSAAWLSAVDVQPRYLRPSAAEEKAGIA
jgi:tRNA threonylcarbamoyladenosine biosynthesis protein TsaB